ncbi:App1 family protein [Tellurirhabdus rosea]|uniref:App1 family protein n=1 Tax=Tellurirhabdus rosea TaxID=2674997 RepID=UPI00225A67A7|nr:phosphatase domain-containing protein [Tellurirhabdus rosea]
MGRKTSLRRKIWKRLGIADRPVVKVYRGYGSENQVLIYGHVFRLSPLPRRKYRQTVLSNTLALLRLFMVRPVGNVTVRLEGDAASPQTITDRNGFFRLEWVPEQPLPPGWHPVRVSLITTYTSRKETFATGEGEVFIPHRTHLGCISDIDDTFLVSHSSNLRKRLHVLLTENALSRDPFEGVVEHYQLLAQLGTDAEHPNPFFYVSSSEWNLYDYICDFSQKNKMPKGVYLLSELKRLRQVARTGQGKHMTKFSRIVRILEAYPLLKFILLGDDTQEDPAIYASLAEHFPGQIICVYLRQVEEKNREQTWQQVEQIRAAGVDCCYFKNSGEARAHSQTLRLPGADSVHNQPAT